MSIEDCFARLTDVERRTVHRMAVGKTDLELARTYKLELTQFCRVVDNIASKLDVKQNNYEGTRRRVMERGQTFFKVKAFPLGQADSSEEGDGTGPELIGRGNVPANPSVSPVERGEPSRSSAATVSTNYVTLPSIEDVVAGLKLLKPSLRDRLERVVKFTKGDGQFEQLAQELGLQPGSLTVSLGAAYKKLGIPHIKGRKTLMVRAFAAYQRELARELGQDLGDKSPPVHELLSSVKVQPEKTASSEPLQPALTNNKANGFGIGVVVPIPTDTMNIDIVSGEFHNREPSSELRNQIVMRRSKGLKPNFVVLYPSEDDPLMARAHVVFLERKE